MSTDNDQLQAFLLASARAHIGSQHAISLLRTQVKALNVRLNKQVPLTNPELEASFKELENEVDKILDDLNGRTDDLLSALESYVNG